MASSQRKKILSDSGGPEMEGGRSSPSTAGNAPHLSRDASTRGSYRKVLPSVPDMDLCVASKMLERRPCAHKGSLSYAPHFLEYALLAEYNLLQKNTVPGVYVIPSETSSLVWLGVIFLREGLYQGGIFRFNLHIPHNYPDGDVPRVIFETSVFHPSVCAETGEANVSDGFGRRWRRNVHHLWHILMHLRAVFYRIDTQHPLNAEAAVLYDSNPDLFNLRVRSCVLESQEHVLDSPPPASTINQQSGLPVREGTSKVPDAHAITFSEYDPDVHDSVRAEIKTDNPSYATPEHSVPGSSWVQRGTFNTFAKEVT